MVNVPRLYRPDGQPARQFGEELIEPGEPFTGETLDVIRTLVDDTDPTSNRPDPQRDAPEETARDDASVSEIAQEITESEAAQADPLPVAAAVGPVDPDLSPKPAAAPVYLDRVPREFLDMPLIQAKPKASAVAPAPAPQAVADHRPEQDAIRALMAQSDPSDTAAADLTPPADATDTPPVPEIPENLSQVITDLDSYASDRLKAEGTQPPQHDQTSRMPSLSEGQPDPVAPRQRSQWRKITVVEGAPGRAVRQFLSKPRNVAVLMLVYISFWRPWFIPTLSLVVILTVTLVAIALGPDKVASICGWWFARLKKRNPQKADRLLRKGNRLLRRLEGLANRLPPAWVQGFYVPDLEAEETVKQDDAQLQSRLERIAAQEQLG